MVCLIGIVKFPHCILAIPVIPTRYLTSSPLSRLPFLSRTNSDSCLFSWYILQASWLFSLPSKGLDNANKANHKYLDQFQLLIIMLVSRLRVAAAANTNHTFNKITRTIKNQNLFASACINFSNASLFIHACLDVRSTAKQTWELAAKASRVGKFCQYSGGKSTMAVHQKG